jgi:hypothetical protein
MNARYFGRALCALIVVGFTACGVPGIPKPPSLDLPQLVTDLHAVRKGNNVFLAWTVPTETTDFLPSRHLGVTGICRSTGAAMSDCRNPVGEIAPAKSQTPQSARSKSAKSVKTQESYADPLPTGVLTDNPAAEIFYAVSVSNDSNRSAGLSNVVQVPAIVAPAAQADFRGEPTAGGIVLTWAEILPSANRPELRYINRVYRREEGSTVDTVVGETPLETTQLVDQSFEWEKTYLYRATVVTQIRLEGKSESQFEGDDSPVVRVFAHDVFPPAVPSGLQAVFSGLGQQPFVDLIWAPDAEADLAGYNIYRREEGSEPRRINSELQKAPAFRDTNVASGHTYFYSVSAVDVRGNESAHSAEANESVP